MRPPNETSPPARNQGAKKSNGVGVSSTNNLPPTASWRAEAAKVLQVLALQGVQA
jgi:hypothetical protein